MTSTGLIICWFGVRIPAGAPINFTSCRTVSGDGSSCVLLDAISLPLKGETIYQSVLEKSPGKDNEPFNSVRSAAVQDAVVGLRNVGLSVDYRSEVQSAAKSTFPNALCTPFPAKGKHYPCHRGGHNFSQRYRHMHAIARHFSIVRVINRAASANKLPTLNR